MHGYGLPKPKVGEYSGLLLGLSGQYAAQALRVGDGDVFMLDINQAQVLEMGKRAADCLELES